MSLLKLSIDRTWSQSACPGVYIGRHFGVVSKFASAFSEEGAKDVPKGASTWIAVVDRTLAQDTSLRGYAMEFEGRAGVLQVAE